MINHFGDINQDHDSSISPNQSHNVSKSRPGSKYKKSQDGRGTSKTKKDENNKGSIFDDEQNSVMDEDKNSEISIGQYQTK